jgi:hypothetical protein
MSEGGTHERNKSEERATVDDHTQIKSRPAAMSRTPALVGPRLAPPGADQRLAAIGGAGENHKVLAYPTRISKGPQGKNDDPSTRSTPKERTTAAAHLDNIPVLRIATTQTNCFSSPPYRRMLFASSSCSGRRSWRALLTYAQTRPDQ